MDRETNGEVRNPSWAFGVKVSSPLFRVFAFPLVSPLLDDANLRSYFICFSLYVIFFRVDVSFSPLFDNAFSIFFPP